LYLELDTSLSGSSKEQKSGIHPSKEAQTSSGGTNQASKEEEEIIKRKYTMLLRNCGLEIM
jgi:hypothetical protein